MIDDGFNILFCGDVVGRAGRDAIHKYLKKVVNQHDVECTIVNGENAAAGFGITGAICDEFYKSGVNVITTGNHIWDQKEIVSHIARDPFLLRPINYPEGTLGNGICLFETKSNQRIMIVNAMARLFMDSLDDPFFCMKKISEKFKLKSNCDAIILDFHGEATSEKMAMGHYLDGKVSFVVGTHTHVPTADHQILPHGTAYMTDAGMCGDYNSVVGMDKEIAISRFVNKLPSRLRVSEGEATFCGVIVRISKFTGLALSIQPIRLGGRLESLEHNVS